ncbi:hypothetical protein ACIQV3_35760 [Streptomyces sp. NPDC099050]|uniref:hypothetical protein n=1 Tax=Streptomyces sp. NPDC099050 TaxID=3366100 RepID=UPI00380B55B0
MTTANSAPMRERWRGKGRDGDRHPVGAPALYGEDRQLPAIYGGRVALDVELEAEPHSADVREFLWTEFTRNGAMSAPYFAPLLVERRRALAQRAVEALLEDVRRDTGHVLTVGVTSEAPSSLEPAGHVSVGDETIQGIDPSDIFVETAEGLQCLLVDRDRLIWPMCPEHRVGAHAMRTEAGAVWMCSVTSHEVAPITV